MPTPPPFIWPARIRFADTDASQRIHYTAIFKHFEAAEQEFLRTLGFGFTTPENRNYGFPRVHVECTMTGALVYDDLVDIAVTVARVGRTSYTLAFEVIKQGTTVTTGKVTVVCLDLQTQKSRPLPDPLALGLAEQFNN